ncbi:hypothetical protein H2248_003224 [Termitomyces sp. 'cryptogamus']|nr:hypothetical protein H2248_003224 [Termitomyces sp. 'cryptogamus']
MHTPIHPPSRLNTHSPIKSSFFPPISSDAPPLRLIPSNLFPREWLNVTGGAV